MTRGRLILMSDILHPDVLATLSKHAMQFEAIECDPALADTADFLEHYGFSADMSANTIVVVGKSAEPLYAACLLLADSRLDVNKTVRKKLGVRRISFANPDVTKEITGMELGGVTPVALPKTLPLLVDQRVMSCEKIVLGGGNRSSKLLLSPDELLKLSNVEVIEGLANPQ